MLYPRSILGSWRAESRGSLRGMYTTCGFPCQRFPRACPATTGTREPSSMEFQDKVLTCIDCGAEFVFTAGEQLFFYDKRFKNEPKRCKACKSKRVAVLSAPPAPGNGHHYTRVETRATCSQCGKETTVPFRPTQGRPIFCRECFTQKKTAAAS